MSDQIIGAEVYWACVCIQSEPKITLAARKPEKFAATRMKNKNRSERVIRKRNEETIEENKEAFKKARCTFEKQDDRSLLMELSCVTSQMTAWALYRNIIGNDMLIVRNESNSRGRATV